MSECSITLPHSLAKSGNDYHRRSKIHSIESSYPAIGEFVRKGSRSFSTSAASALKLLFLPIPHLLNFGSTLCYLKPIHTLDIHLSILQFSYQVAEPKKKANTDFSSPFIFTSLF